MPNGNDGGRRVTRAQRGKQISSPPGKKEKKDKKSPKTKFSKTEMNIDAFVNGESPQQTIEELSMPPLEGDSNSDPGPIMANSGESKGAEATRSEQSSDNGTTFHGFNEEDLGDLGKIASLLKTLSADMKEVKEGQGKILVELNVIKQDHKKMSEKLEQHSKDIKALQDHKTENDKAIGDIVEIVENQDRWLKSHDTRLQVLDATLSDLVVESNVSGEGVVKNFPYRRTVVALNVPYEDGENIDLKAKGIIHNFLQLRDINIVRVTRKGLTDERLGIVKIELPSKQAVDEVIKNKHKLNQFEDPSISGIFIRKSLPDEVRQQQRNNDMIIKYLDPQGLLTKTKREDIVPTNQSRGGYGGRGHGRGRGSRGRGGRGRGSPRGRGGGHARGGRRGFRSQVTVDYSAWAPNANNSQPSTQGNHTPPSYAQVTNPMTSIGNRSTSTSPVPSDGSMGNTQPTVQSNTNSNSGQSSTPNGAPPRSNIPTQPNGNTQRGPSGVTHPPPEDK